MKQILTLLLLLCSLTAMAQDIIVKKDGTIVQAVVEEVLTSEVKYKKFSNLNGPTYTIAIADILSITYKNGEVDHFNTPAPKEEEPVQPVAIPQETPAPNHQLSDEELLAMFENPQKSPSQIEYVPIPEEDFYNKKGRPLSQKKKTMVQYLYNKYYSIPQPKNKKIETYIALHYSYIPAIRIKQIKMELKRQWGAYSKYLN